ncbi:MAG: hypothetical protein J7L15_00755, partial [Clostridiales bacterium]|nr:hypothetical protein [Clostridiales bacterium]
MGFTGNLLSMKSKREYSDVGATNKLITDEDHEAVFAIRTLKDAAEQLKKVLKENRDLLVNMRSGNLNRTKKALK